MTAGWGAGGRRRQDILAGAASHGEI